MRRLADQRLRIVVLSLAIAGSFGVRALVQANWEAQPFPVGLSGTSINATASVYDPVLRVHKSWAVGADSSGHPLILQNTGSDWTVAYNETRLGGSGATYPSMSLRTISAWLSPTTNTLNLVAAGEHGLLLYNNGTGWNLQLQKYDQTGERCTVPGVNEANFINPTTKYFNLGTCQPWTTSTLNSSTAQARTKLQVDGSQTEDRFFSVVGDANVYLRASGNFADGLYLNWPIPTEYRDVFNTVSTTYGIQDLRSLTMNEATGWLVSCNRPASDQPCTAGTSRLFHLTRPADTFPTITDVTPNGFPQNPSAVAFIEDRAMNGGSKLPSHVWVTTDRTDGGKIYRYEYQGGVIGQVDTPEVNNTLGTRATLGSFAGIAAREEVLGGNLIFNPTYEDDFFINGRKNPAHWFTVAALREDIATDDGPDHRLKLAWPDSSLSNFGLTQHLRVDGFTYNAGAQPDIPLRNSESFTKDVQLVDFFADETSANPGLPDFNSLLAKVPGTSTRAMVRISGFITIPQTGDYSFRVGHTKGARLYLGMAATDFTTPRLNDWQAIGTDDTGPINLQAGGGWNGTNAYPFTLEWWNGDPSEPVSDNPQLGLVWKTPGSATYVTIPAANLSHFGNDGTATASQVINQPLLPGQSVRIQAQVKVEFNEALNTLSPRDPRRPQRGWAGVRSTLVGNTDVQNVWSMTNQAVGSSTTAPKVPVDWKVLDYVMTNTSTTATTGITVECFADYGTQAWCGGIRAEFAGGSTRPGGTSRYHVWAVGPAGLLAARHGFDATDGFQWALEDTPRRADLNGVSGDNAQHVWAVGNDDTLFRFTGGNVKGWAWVGSDTADQTDTSGKTASNDAVGWISFNCANTSAASPNGTCNDGPFNYGVHLNGPAVCDTSIGKCSNDANRSCTTSNDCETESADGVVTGRAWFGVTDPDQTLSFGKPENLYTGYCQGEAASGLTANPTGHAQRCAIGSDCLPGTGACVTNTARTIQCSGNPSFPTAAITSCEAVSCAQNPLACRAIGWLSFERSETGDPPNLGDDYQCTGPIDANGNKKCAGTQIICKPSRGNADCPLAKFDNTTGKIQGWGRFLTLKDSKNTGWVRLSSESLTCPAPANLSCQTASGNYNLCRDCKVNDNATPSDKTDDFQQCSLCDAAVDQQPNGVTCTGGFCSNNVTQQCTTELDCAGVRTGNLCSTCGGSSTAQSCQGICQKAFLLNPTASVTNCSSDSGCDTGDRCVGFGHCSGSTSQACITDGECPTAQKCLDVGKVCPVCETCQRWTSALDQSNGQALGWAWSEDFGWIDMSSIRIGNVAWLQTKFGDVYSSKDIGSQSQQLPPSGESNATYLVLAGGKITNFTSAEQATFDSRLPIYQNAPMIPLAQRDKANILGRLDYSNIIGDRITVTGGVFAGSSPDGFPDTQAICNTDVGLCANDRKTTCTGDASCTFTSSTQGKYGRVVDLSNPGFPDAQKFATALSNLDLEGKVYFRKADFPLPTTQIVVGKQNGSGLLVIDGNLRLNGNITYGPNSAVPTLTDDRQLPSFGALVTGNLTISENVSELHGTFYVLGKVTVLSRQSASLDSQLRVFGAMVAHEFDFQRQFLGTIDQPQAAEVIQYDGRLTVNPPPGFQDLSKALPDLKAVTP